MKTEPTEALKALNVHVEYFNATDPQCLYQRTDAMKI